MSLERAPFPRRFVAGLPSPIFTSTGNSIDAPKLATEVWIAGLDLIPRRAIAIVGTREPDPRASEFTRALAAAIAQTGAVVISGGARGIDTDAHRGAIDSGGATWCVSPTSADRPPYPPENSELFDEIVLRGGTMVWPFPLGGELHPGRFFARNRVLVAMAEAIVVVQAPEPSGALHAASCARRLGRPLWVVSPPAWDVRFAGSHALIERGARVLTSIPRFLRTMSLARGDSDATLPVSEVSGLGDAYAAESPGARGGRHEEAASAPLLAPLTRPQRRPSSAAHPTSPGAVTRREFNPTEQALLHALDASPRHLDSVLELAHLSPQAASTALLTLALENVVVEGPSGFYRRKDAG